MVGVSHPWRLPRVSIAPSPKKRSYVRAVYLAAEPGLMGLMGLMGLIDDMCSKTLPFRNDRK